MPKPKRTFTDEQIKQLQTMAGLGLTQKQMAALCDISLATFERWLSENEAARSAVERGNAKAVMAVAKTAYQMAIAGNQPAMTMFYLKTRAGWRETDRIDMNTKISGAIEHKNTAELLQEYESFAPQLGYKLIKKKNDSI